MVCPVTEDTLGVSQVTLSHTQVIVEALEGRGLPELLGGKQMVVCGVFKGPDHILSTCRCY